MDEDKKTQLYTELHLMEVDLQYLHSTPVLIRRMNHGLELLLSLEEALELIKLSEATPDGYKRMSLEDASWNWDCWRCPRKGQETNLSIAEIMEQMNPMNDQVRFLGWCKANKIAPVIKPGDFFWNTSYRGEDKERIFLRIKDSTLLSNILLSS